MMGYRKTNCFLMSYGVRRNDKQKTCSFYPYLVCVKDVYESTTQVAERKQTLNKTNHKLAKLP